MRMLRGGGGGARVGVGGILRRLLSVCGRGWMVLSMCVFVCVCVGGCRRDSVCVCGVCACARAHTPHARACVLAA